ncbi:E3 ubiquitin-protein ligase BRE1-like 1 isoform X1 [Phoenix dactylifera]|uniref:E3 ubiquitin-protein ligase BRE1-like 1 isoform X1 n=1 Tax=Phoenix dactylifera TaxID=42345 RepID=A0A8B7CDS7_PHODC|nr:E3 ubiquitin-protein ligase BRE1-like 1 isoform X1 [Phoenix dactylifera]XP_008797110.2 E3 ubiquitin-protein ligase BRE1-like 1 isoform X1 [Phoenix dactylifera]XP_008797112.2 E3 ubiquitin-protein ligase BRE1-like 1 isoform X1 [Phoenix dactylifera]XP_038989384.1 E3 ubiquitin-protein ligase BRE1-like 1 isoform X1 [Phoenix dactylifera]XP_038989385.1 E3 ubiquitin-protein ligase BRE1-like 1 isoform X1 [Phoenix dactylifera]
MSRSRSSRETFQDLELRLGPAYLSKGGMLAANCLRGCPDFIMIEDDDDDVQICAAASSGETFRVFPYSSPWAPAIREEDLELRLGVGASSGYSGNSNGGANTLEDRFRNPNAWKSSKWMHHKSSCINMIGCGQASSSRYMSDSIEVKLRCAICMDTMKEETSTICGHVFCKPCITDAIRVQKRCPTCREKLSISNIHRIYLPGATS